MPCYIHKTTTTKVFLMFKASWIYLYILHLEPGNIAGDMIQLPTSGTDKELVTVTITNVMWPDVLIVHLEPLWEQELVLLGCKQYT